MKILLRLNILACFLSVFCAHAQELIQDRDFQQGFYVRDRFNGSVLPSPIRCDNTVAPPVWNVAEWSSQSSVATITPVTLGDGMCQWADNNKDFRFGPIGAQPYQLYFGANSQSEYNNVYRLPGQPWPHLLVEQRLSAPFDFPGQGPGCPALSLMDSLVFQVDAQLLYNLTIKNAGYDSTMHAAQFLIFFTVQNLNQSSSGYGKYVWLGVPLYDDRTPVIPGTMSYDVGTQTLINNIPYGDIANTSMHSGNWIQARVNILPYAKAALDTAWANGFINESTNFADYKIGGMNMGWELTGMNIATVGVNGISLFAYANTTAIKNAGNKGPGILVYPNPAGDSFVLNADCGEEQVMRVIDLQGNLRMLKKIGDETVIDCSELPPGIYSVSVRGTKGAKTQKIVIVR